MIKENLLDFIMYHDKWHSNSQKNRKIYKYNTNDDLIEEIFKRIGISNGTFVEFGAWDGIHLSNTRLLFENGWKGLLIEPNNSRFYDLKNNYLHTNVAVDNSFLNLNDCLFDDVYEKHFDNEIDFCSIDIDGLDLEIFETFKRNMPKVICIEGGQVLHPLENRVPQSVASKNVQHSLKVMSDVFDQKGYKLLCSYQDSIFIKKEYYNLFNVEENIIKNYIDGLICLPRIPYILNLLEEVKYQNEIIDIALEGVPSSVTEYVKKGNSNHKKAWIDNFYPTIKNNLLKYRETIK